jgi:hypothetical protein
MYWNGDIYFTLLTDALDGLGVSRSARGGHDKAMRAFVFARSAPLDLLGVLLRRIEKRFFRTQTL